MTHSLCCMQRYWEIQSQSQSNFGSLCISCLTSIRPTCRKEIRWISFPYLHVGVICLQIWQFSSIDISGLSVGLEMLYARTKRFRWFNRFTNCHCSGTLAAKHATISILQNRINIAKVIRVSSRFVFGKLIIQKIHVLCNFLNITTLYCTVLYILEFGSVHTC